jgi:hypothetical protein
MARRAAMQITPVRSSGGCQAARSTSSGDSDLGQKNETPDNFVIDEKSVQIIVQSPFSAPLLLKHTAGKLGNCGYFNLFPGESNRLLGVGSSWRTHVMHRLDARQPLIHALFRTERKDERT